MARDVAPVACSLAISPFRRDGRIGFLIGLACLCRHNAVN
jgi:hypothetical protein